MNIMVPAQAARMRPSREAAEAAVRTLIEWAGDNPDREGLRGTPDRVVRAYEEFFAGCWRQASDFVLDIPLLDDADYGRSWTSSSVPRSCRRFNKSCKPVARIAGRAPG